LNTIIDDCASREHTTAQLISFEFQKYPEITLLEPFNDFHGCGFSPRFSRASGSRGTNHRLQASRPLGGGLIRRKAFQAGVYPPPAQPTGFSR
jgi:hypothetical protein